MKIFMQNFVPFDHFQALDIRIGRVLSAQRVEGADKLLLLEMDFGDEKRQLVAGLALTHQPEQLVGKLLPVLLNLEPKIIRGIESQGMILAVVVDNTPVLLLPEKEVPTGSSVR